MAQRSSGYKRKPKDDYPTPAWVTRLVIPHLGLAPSATILEPSPGAGAMVNVLRDAGYNVIAQEGDFLSSQAGHAIDAVIGNPPYGQQGRIALRFIEHALRLTEARRGTVAMLLKVDFDSGSTRSHVFDHQAWATKIVLRDRIVWFEPKIASPSENHAWFVWRWQHQGAATLAYARAA
jgi:hypothetical protein